MYLIWVHMLKAHLLNYYNTLYLPSHKGSVHNFIVWSFERKTYTWSSRKSSHSMKSGGFHMDFRWNPVDFIQISRVKSGRFHMDFMGEICWISGEIHQISYRFHGWNPPDFMKSVGFRKTIARNGKPYVSFPVVFHFTGTNNFTLLHFSLLKMCQ